MKKKYQSFTVISIAQKFFYFISCLFLMVSLFGCPTIPDKNIIDEPNTSMTQGVDTGTGTSAGGNSDGANLFLSLFGGAPFSWPEIGIDMDEPITRSVVNTLIAAAGLTVIAKVVHSISKAKTK